MPAARRDLGAELMVRSMIERHPGNLAEAGENARIRYSYLESRVPVGGIALGGRIWSARQAW